MTGDETRGQQAGGTTRGEWVLGIAGALLALAVCGLLAFQAITRDGEPALQLEVTGWQQGPGGYAVSVQVTNSGGRTAEAVEVSGEVIRGGTTVETGSVTIDYVPADSRRTATLVFSEDPEGPGADLQVSLDGYTSM